MIYLGIDPGKDGAMAIIRETGIQIIPFDELDYADAVNGLRGHRVLCCLERVGARPGQGVTSMFSFGENYGFIRGLLAANKIPHEKVMPKKWKKEFGISDKNDSISVCMSLFPSVRLFRTDRCKKQHDGMAEALLMAEYARRHIGIGI